MLALLQFVPVAGKWRPCLDFDRDAASLRHFSTCAWPDRNSRALPDLHLVSIGKKWLPLLDLCVSSLRRGHANLLCIVPILTDGNLRRGSTLYYLWQVGTSALSSIQGLQTLVIYPRLHGKMACGKSCQHPKGFPGRPRP